MKNPVSIYLITLAAMIVLLIGIDWFMGTPPLSVLQRSFFSFFKYVDKVEFFLVIFLFILPVLTFMWSSWMKKKQNA
ncbi:hypothetical protein [Fictibacillus halophilus]|uniref:hypothetical protein n=1 Tax=Fictibacillus halophilus TaxID=1610490 RepID=UPI001CFADB85|nr:hypothetical protein [Fictibacillus halophilus]